MGLLDGKVAIVTGAGGGLGREHALLLAQEGAAIVVNDLGGARDGTGAGSAMADQVVDEIKLAGGEAVANYESVTSVEGGEKILKTALDAFDQVDILINNAGILRDKTLSKMEESEWDSVVAVHLKGTYCVTRPVFKHMKERGAGGVIVNTSSTSGLVGNFGQTNYGAAKAGIAGFTRCLALEGKKYNIRVWGLAPVAVTRMTEDLAGMGNEESRAAMSPARVSPAVLYMVSDLSKDKTGRFLFAGGKRVAEIKIVMSDGLRKGEGDISAQDIAQNEDKVFLPDEPLSLM
ncbi:MAG: SDR family NAD(P)-dependent oxidoreductase [Deltaproteobacteria bacterium]|nr:SDR family NAD(P)-dependent oxidoreductase [Deltaproteobacteria bacterium]MCZ6713835.1 SDR family NAD(P)-dependent oxidoreductase [Deltaproteobacteria bacterium]MCZ6821568.1 SDR family NAD(P)-dependent oxidoreductase [Deltaproteobacteria bacterium]TDI97152.1 MAG: SDR family NAD(P)-dependent oxidoreductase [Deltaproteobacteria bacterium]TDJ10007.1 MAG: SDR family NAD(P)-dependent oxidoreductase [Deltaproteobacteria bacterium]